MLAFYISNYEVLIWVLKSTPPDALAKKLECEVEEISLEELFVSEEVFGRITY